ncbi:MAG: N-acetyltransferase family protein [Gracilimonas sp.]|uniref:arsinothricin resistance N-acetyltransferase ArsN1 family B n=1 Tax=Gracilimonas sp. TaxID=1974203 RepID=UPI0019AF3080|nr:arsinothricin resistance N-acetyltransferase ArsN1 family B [Gracilimonas sp.]MBD3616133.1 N-acetyltransferase family protein [Gracilimonas sp.]
MTGKVTIRSATIEDSKMLTRIYNYYVLNTTVTFEEEKIKPEEMTDRIQEVKNAGLPWLVAETGSRILGYAYATKWKGRCAYRFSVESTVYVDPDKKGRGVGSGLYAELFRILKENGIHAVIGGIALPNEASIALHEKFEMTKVAHFTEVGYKFDKWIDVGYWQRIL